MQIKRILMALYNRLPGNILFNTLIESVKLYKNNPECCFYKNQIKLNLRRYFFLKHKYTPLLYKKADVSDLNFCYHITEKDNIESIMKYGIINHKTNIVFLTCTRHYISVFKKYKNFSNPVVLRIDVKTMVEKGFLFFKEENKNSVITTEKVSPEFIDIDNNFFLCKENE